MKAGHLHRKFVYCSILIFFSIIYCLAPEESLCGWNIKYHDHMSVLPLWLTWCCTALCCQFSLWSSPWKPLCSEHHFTYTSIQSRYFWLFLTLWCQRLCHIQTINPEHWKMIVQICSNILRSISKSVRCMFPIKCFIKICCFPIENCIKIEGFQSKVALKSEGFQSKFLFKSLGS